ncbi:MAG: peptidase [Thiotrichaceae bacterium]|nr:MAG: peptidase [Thiotrichaceae bacterium]
MNNNYFNMHVLLAAFIILSPLQVAMADDDYIEARRLLDSGDIQPLEIILKDVRQTFPGKVLEVELEIEDQQIVYELEILGDDGVIKEIYINAKTGKLLFSKEDD